MRVIMEYDPKLHPPVLKFYIHGAPHRRAHRATIEQYRKHLFAACQISGVQMPINNPVDMVVLFISPTSPDLGNSYLALERALDGSTTETYKILSDDSLVQRVVMSKIYT